MKIRRLLAFVFSLVVLTVLAGCAPPSDGEKTTPKTTLSQTHFDELPFSVPYEDSSFQVAKIEAYDSVENFTHNLYCILTLDVSNLSEKQVNFLYKDDLDIDGSFKYKDKEINLTRVFRTYFTDSKKVNIYFVNSAWAGELRDTFDGSDYTFTINIKGDPMSNNDSLGDPYFYSNTFKGPFKSADDMDKVDYDYFVKGLDLYLEGLKGSFD